MELASIPLAALAGVLGILSPCVWPLVPIIMASAAGKGRLGPLFLALGLSLSFSISGVFLSYVLLSLALDTELVRFFAAAALIALGTTLVSKKLSEKSSIVLSNLSSRLNFGSFDSANVGGQFVVGFLLGLVWLPCVGPTLGAAIALASLGQSMLMAFIVMFSFGLGTALALTTAALISEVLLVKLRPDILANSAKLKIALGLMLILLGVFVLSGWDKLLEAFAIEHLPDWSTSL